jgi:hypothetical protein
MFNSQFQYKTQINQENKQFIYNILNNMFIKRFNLTCNCIIDDYENGNKQIPSILNGNYNHIACILNNKKCFKKGKSFILWYK